MTHRVQSVIRPITISYTGCEDAIFKPDYYEYPEYPQKVEDHPPSSKDCHASARFRELGKSGSVSKSGVATRSEQGSEPQGGRKHNWAVII
jgi:hypothetical protein